jgi:hypothetical protein
MLAALSTHMCLLLGILMLCVRSLKSFESYLSSANAPVTACIWYVGMRHTTVTGHIWPRVQEGILSERVGKCTAHARVHAFAQRIQRAFALLPDGRAYCVSAARAACCICGAGRQRRHRIHLRQFIDKIDGAAMDVCACVALQTMCHVPTTWMITQATPMPVLPCTCARV